MFTFIIKAAKAVVSAVSAAVEFVKAKVEEIKSSDAFQAAATSAPGRFAGHVVRAVKRYVRDMVVINGITCMVARYLVKHGMKMAKASRIGYFVSIAYLIIEGYNTATRTQGATA